MESLWERIKCRKREALTTYKEVCSKRSRSANVLLSLALSFSFVLSLSVIAVSIMVFFIIIDGETIANGITWIFYSVFCMYHMAGFIGGNRKKDILPAAIGSVFVWTITLLFCKIMIMLDSSSYDEESETLWSNLILMAVTFAESLVVNAICFGLIRAVMAIRKDGISAWRLMQDDCKERSKMEKIWIAVACLLWVAPAFAYLLPYFK